MHKALKILITDIILLALVIGIFHYVGGIKLIRQSVENYRQHKAEKAAAEEAKKADEQKVEDIDAGAVDTGEWSLLLVNPWNEIPEGYVDSIETVETEGGYEVDSRVKESLEDMLADCREAGNDPVIISAFRSRETQQHLYDTTANKNDTAVPGTSEHECGLAIDIIDSSSSGWADPLIKEQEELPAQKWLMENCQNYGFILRYPEDKEDITGIIYEPWHYRYVGEEHAKKIMEGGQCLEEYLRKIDNDKEKIQSN